uniref:Signal peptidase complex subunit 3 n=1 Tax=Panagrolaimus sp. JU765 TaxID=591449 RepID=A0AC34R7H7_9BILA
MHTIWSRANAIFAFTLTAMSAVTFAVFLSTIYSNRIAPVTISAANPRVRVMPDYISESGKSDHAMVSLNIQADVSSIFNWNVKQLFMYLVAEYKTPKNEVNQVVLWDKIVLRANRAVIIEEKIAPKYYFIDDGEHLLGHQNVTLIMKWNIIPNAGYLANAQGEGSYRVQFPTSYISGRF